VIEINILIVSGSFPPRSFGGVTSVAYNISKKLVDKGHDITVYTTDAGNDIHTRLSVKSGLLEGINVKYFKNISNYLAFKYRLYLPFGMAEYIKRHIAKFDVIHMCEYRSIMSVLIHYYSMKNKVPYVIQAHGSLQNNTMVGRYFDLFCGIHIIKDAGKCFALNNTEKYQYEKLRADIKSIEIIPNGIDYVFSNWTKYEFRKRYGILDEEKIVLFLGRLHKSKGIEILVDAFAKLTTLISEVRLVIVGPDDGYDYEIRRRAHLLNIESKVLLTGPLYGDEKMMAYCAADVFVSPSFKGLPLTFLEACICGLPIITTKISDELDWIDNNVGYIVDEQDLAKAILKILLDNDLRETFSNNARNMISYFEWDKIIDYIESKYNELVKHREV